MFSDADWGSIMMRQYYSLLGKHIQDNPEKFQKVYSSITNIPKKLTIKINGSHFFFVGQLRAKKTADAIINLLIKWHKFHELGAQ